MLPWDATKTEKEDKEGMSRKKALPEAIIDYHVHLFPDRLFDAVWEKFRQDYNWDVLQKLYYRQVVDYLRQRGVGPIVYSNYAHKGGVARALNDWNLSVVDELDDVYCLGAYHPDDSDALDMASSVLDHPRIVGFKLQFLVTAFYPHDTRLFPLYELVMDRGKRLLLHIGTGPFCSPYVGAENFLEVLERGVDVLQVVLRGGGPGEK